MSDAMQFTEALFRQDKYCVIHSSIMLMTYPTMVTVVLKVQIFLLPHTWNHFNVVHNLVPPRVLGDPVLPNASSLGQSCHRGCWSPSYNHVFLSYITAIEAAAFQRLAIFLLPLLWTLRTVLPWIGISVVYLIIECHCSAVWPDYKVQTCPA